MTRTLLLTLLFCLLPWTVKAQNPKSITDSIPPISLDDRVAESWPSIDPILEIMDSLYALTPKPTIRVRIETLVAKSGVICKKGFVTVYAPPVVIIQIDSVFIFDRIDTTWTKE